MRIGINCFWHKLGEAGGTQIYRQQLIEALLAFDTDNEYVLLKWEGDELELSQPGEKCRATVFPTPSTGKLAGIARFAKEVVCIGRRSHIAEEVDRLSLDVVHHPTTTIYPLSSATPAVLTFFDMQPEFYPQHFLLSERIKRRMLYRLSVKKAAMIIAPSLFTARTLEERYHVASPRIRQIPVGIPSDYGRVDQGGALTIVRRWYGLPDEFALYPANLWPHKNHKQLLRSLALLNLRIGVRINLVCTGARPVSGVSLRQMSEEVGFQEEQLFDLGFVRLEDMPALYSMAKMAVCPSLFEGFGIPVVEAMACGCPVVCANKTSLPEVGGDAVELFDPFDLNDMCTKLMRVWRDEDLREQMIRKGFARAAQFRWERLVPRVVEVYKRAAGS